jgi:hypothetical protein
LQIWPEVGHRFGLLPGAKGERFNHGVRCVHPDSP